MTTLTFSVITEIDQCRKIWQRLNTGCGLYDQWAFRYDFFRQYDHQAHFIVAEDQGEVIACLPLQFHCERKQYEIFGGTFMENNSCLPPGLPEDITAKLLELSPAPCYLNDLDEQYLGCSSYEENKYVLNLANFKSIDDYVAYAYHGKSKANFLKRIKKVKEQSPKIISDHQDFMELMFELNILNFGEESTFLISKRKEIFRSLISDQHDHHLRGYLIDGKPAAASLSIRSGEQLVYLNAGVNKVDYPNLGSYVIYDNINLAIALGCTEFDAGAEDLGWKERWKLAAVPQYQVRR